MTRLRNNRRLLLAAAACLAAGASLLGALLASQSFPGREIVLVLDGALLGFGLPLIGEYVVVSMRRARQERPPPAAEPAVTPGEEEERARLAVKARAASEAELRQAVQKLADENRALRGQVDELVQPLLAKYGGLSQFGFELATLYVAGGPAASPPEAVNRLLRLAEGLGIADVVSTQIDRDLHIPSQGGAGEHVRRVFRDIVASLPERTDARYWAALDAGRCLSAATLCATRNDRPDETIRRDLFVALRKTYVEPEVAETTARVLLQFERGALTGPQVLPWLAVLKHFLEERAHAPEATPSILQFAQENPFADAARLPEELRRCVALLARYSTADAALMEQALDGTQSG